MQQREANFATGRLCLALCICAALSACLPAGDDDSEGGTIDLGSDAVIHPPIDTGDSDNGTDQSRTLSFGGLTWAVRSATELSGPGPNYFSDSTEDAWVDSQGRLHLRVVQRGGNWWCTQVAAIGQVGYGTYVFYVSGNVHWMDQNIVLGFFTWDDNAYEVGHLNEIDIEITRWGNPVWRNLHYSVQPLYGPDTENERYDERSDSAIFVLFDPKSTHTFSWRPDGVNFASYAGYGNPTVLELNSWHFSAANPARRSHEASLSTPVGIPVPSATTAICINLWLTDKNKDGIGDPPSDSADQEVIIDSFEYTPM